MSLAAQSLGDRVVALAGDREDARGLTAFAAAYVHREARDGEEPEAVLAEVQGAFELLADRDARLSAVRALNPTTEADGYERLGSVLEVTTDDSPYLVDSVEAALEARGLGVRRVVHPIVGTERDDEGTLRRVCSARDAARRESLMHFELDRRLEHAELARIEQAAHDVLAAVHRVVADFPAMSQQLESMIDLARSDPAARDRDPDAVAEAVAFLRWLVEGNFTFLGFRDLAEPAGLGLLADGEPEPLEPAEALLAVTKTRRLSPVRRHVRMDDIAVRAGNRELRLVGLFTRKAYAAPAVDTPLVHHKLLRILDAEDLIAGSHDQRKAVAIFSSVPKDELFEAPWETLRNVVAALLALAGDETRVLLRRPEQRHSAALIVAVPRRCFATSLVERVRSIVRRAYGGDVELENHLVVDEQLAHARLHLTVHAKQGGLPEIDPEGLQRDVADLIRSWDDAVERALRPRVGVLRARALAAAWCRRFPDSYRAWTSPRLAAADVECLARLHETDDELVVGLQDDGERSRLALCTRDGKVGLSDVLPTLEMLGLRVDDERPAQLAPADGGETPYVQAFGVLGPDGEPLDVEAAGERLAQTVLAVRRDATEADRLSRLVLVAGLTWEQVAVLRAYRVFRQRATARFSLRHDAEAFAAHPQIAARLVAYFERRHMADGDDGDDLREAIVAALDDVESLDEDRVLRDQLTLVDATLRTNAFRPGRDALALKLRSGDIPGISKPAPHVEIYVHAVEVEGVHLRGGAIARGGLRWSDRLDFRTEVFGLMRAQMTKNAVIVPTGAKGGFYLKRRPDDPDDLRDEVARQYKRYIRALLDVTDDIDGADVVHPDAVRIHDGEDPYLVVAADKGTASFSDTANAIAIERGFWLGDAFASGGSEGYDHKRLGITARGAWESTKRHFRELGVDPERDAVTAVGVGDMSGDVFGNGMLLSATLKLVAAYDHRHVFVDPDPDPERAWTERKRLFELAGSSWDDYDRDVLSDGGGVWSRRAKSIALPAAAREALGIEDERLAPDEVVRAILRAPADLLFFGGIGTVVKASSESDADARDRASDAIRVDASDVRARVVVEGGNLGCTQAARIELAAGGASVNADFIDNSAGVDCSDHEVNLKILLDLAVSGGRLDADGRHELLRVATDDVVAHVLQDSYRQARILSREVTISPRRVYAYQDLMRSLEDEGRLHRKADALPDGEELGRRRRSGTGLHRPELAVLLAHSKQSLTDALLADATTEGSPPAAHTAGSGPRQRDRRPPPPLIDDPWLERDLRAYFPPPIVERLGDLLGQHRLRRELTATLVANQLVDAVGPVFVSRLVTELGARPAQVVRAYRIAREVTGAVQRLAAIDALDADIDHELEVELVVGVEGLVEAVTRWYLLHAPEGGLQELVERGHEGFEAIEDALEREPPEHVGPRLEWLREGGVPEALALDFALAGDLVFAPDVISVAQQCGRPVEDVGTAFARMGDELRFGWLETELDALPARQRTQRWALQALRDDARRARRDLVARALGEAPDAGPADAVEAFVAARADRARHLTEVARSLAVDGADLAALMVVVRKLRALAG